MAIITGMATELVKRGSWCGETQIQKATFLLQELVGIDVGFDFMLYKHGPFSFDLRDTVTEMAADGLIDYVVRNPDYGPSLLPTADSATFLERFPKTISRYSRQIQFVAESLGNKGVSDLERIATAVFIINRLKSIKGERRAEEMVRLKPHISPFDAKEAIREAERLINSAKSY